MLQTTLKNILVKSGITISDKKISLFFIKNRRLLQLFRFKINPKTLSDDTLNDKEFSMLVSEISTGPAFKTTGFERHNSSDNILIDYIEKFHGKKRIADIGVSDGTSSLYVLQKIQVKKIDADLFLYDKYTHLNLIKKWLFSIYTNIDNEIVYVQFLCFLLYIYPFRIISKKTTREIISFDNPILKKFGLKIEYFDIFNTKLEMPVDFIKCANILNPVYFSPIEIRIALNNISSSLKESGYLFIIHNTKNFESLIVLKKENETFMVEKQDGDDGLLEYLKINDGIITIG